MNRRFNVSAVTSLARSGLTVAGLLLGGLLGTGVIPAPHARAQVAGFNLRGGDPVELQKTRFEQQIKVRIDEIRRVCELDDAQVKRLEIGGKGAVTRAVKEYRKQVKALQQKIGGQIRLGGNIFGNRRDDEDEDAQDGEQDRDERSSDELEDGADLNDDPADEEEDEDEGQPEQPLNGVFQLVAPMMADGEVTPEQQKVWRNTLKNVLTDEQREKLAAADRARRAYHRDSGVRNKVGELDSLLRFTQEQREAMMEVVDRVLGPTYEAPERKSMVQVAIGDQAKLRKKHVESILSPAQLEVFMTVTNKPLNGVAAVQMNMQQIRQVVPAGPADQNKAFFGISISSSLGNDERVRVDQVVPDGPAHVAGIRKDDIIREVDGEPVENVHGFFAMLRKSKPGDTLKVIIDRDDESLDVEVTLAERE